MTDRERVGRPGISEADIAQFHTEMRGNLFRNRNYVKSGLENADSPQYLRGDDVLNPVLTSIESRYEKMGPIQREAQLQSYLFYFARPLFEAVKPMGPKEQEDLTEIAMRWYGRDETLYLMMMRQGSSLRGLELASFEGWFHEVAKKRIEERLDVFGESDARGQILGVAQQEGIYLNSLQWTAYGSAIAMHALEDDLRSEYKEIHPGEIGAAIESVQFSALNKLFEYVERDGIDGTNSRTVERLAGRAFAFPLEYMYQANETLRNHNPSDLA